MISDAIDPGFEGMQTRVRLTATCKRLREMLLSRAFETVRFSNDRRISDSALLAAHNHGIHIKKLYFLGFDPVLSNSGAPRHAVETRNHILPYSACLLFEAERGLLPNLQTFIIEFDHTQPDPMDFFQSQGIFSGSTQHHSQNLHAPYDFPASSLQELWNNTYSALASNSTVPHLVINNWTPTIMPRALLEPKWWAYLGRLQTFELTPADYIGSRNLNTTDLLSLYSSQEATLWGVRKMDQCFFVHLCAARTIKFSGSKRLLVGSTMYPMGGAMLPFGTLVLKSVVSVELSRVFISSELIQFIRRQRDTLRNLVLNDMLADALHGGFKVDNPYSIPLLWSRFFHALCGIQGLVLTNFQVTSICPLDKQEARARIRGDVFPDVDVADEDIDNWFGGVAGDEVDNYFGDHAPHAPDGEDVHRVVSRIKSEIGLAEKEHRDLKLFGYAQLHHKTRLPRYHPDLNRRRFEDGEDQAAYEMFMDQLRINQAEVQA